MNHRGLVGFRCAQRDYLTYNHDKTLPDQVGLVVLQQLRLMLREWGLEELRERVGALRLVAGMDEVESSELRGKAKHWPPPDNVLVDEDADHYSILRGLQGDLRGIVMLGVMIDSAAFIKDSASCEWAFVVDLDARRLEVYLGGQKYPHQRGRYGSDESAPLGDRNYPCALLTSWSFGALPSDGEYVRRLSELFVREHQPGGGCFYLEGDHA